MKIQVNSSIQYTCTPDWHLNRYWDDYTLWYISAGGCYVHTGETTIYATPDSCYIFAPHQTYKGGYLEDHKLSVFVVHFDILAGDLSVETNREYLPASPLVIRDQLRRLQWQFSLGNLDESGAWLKTVLRMLHEDDDIVRPGNTDVSEHGPTIERLCKAVFASPEQPIRVNDLARQAFLSPDHFRRIFKKQVGVTPKSWIIQCRLEKAKGLLLSTNYSIEHIAALCGFQNVYFFSRQFKKKVGVAPSKYRM